MAAKAEKKPRLERPELPEHLALAHARSQDHSETSPLGLQLRLARLEHRLADHPDDTAEIEAKYQSDLDAFNNQK